MSKQDQTLDKVEEQKQLAKTRKTKIQNADIVDIKETKNKIKLHLYGPGTGGSQEIIEITGDFEKTGSSIISDEDRETLELLDQLQDEAFNFETMTDSQIVLKAAIQKVKSLWK